MTRLTVKLLILLSLLVGYSCADNKTPIAESQAFQFSVEPTTTDSILAKWLIEPGYYLYKDRFSFKVKSPEEADIGLILKPKGIEKEDKILGKHYVYENNLTISIPILNPTNQPMELLVHYQGCAEWGFCYPPTSKLVTIASRTHLTPKDIIISDYTAPRQIKASGVVADRTIISEQSNATNILEDKSGTLALIIFFGFGLLLAFTPCVLPLIPILSGIIVGHGHQLSTKRAFALSLSYVLGMSIAFAIAGLIVGLLGNSVQAALQTPWVLVLFSLLFVLLALSLFGFYDLKLPQRWQQKVSALSHKQKAGHILSSAIMGALSTLIVSPCVSAPLVGALAYIGNTGNAVFGGFALFALGLGMGAPLLLIGTSFGKLLPKAGHWMIAVKNFFGVVMLGVAIWMLERIIPGPLSLALWAILAIVTSIYIGALSPVKPNPWSKLGKGFGLALLVYGILSLIGAAMGNSNLLQPIKFDTSIAATSKAVASHGFTRIKSIDDFNTQLTAAKGKLVMLDFYADWCVACKEMEAHTFSNLAVKKAMEHFVLLQADVTANDSVDKALEKKFGVIAPPTILFFNKEGEEIKSARIVGEMKAQPFLSHLRKVMALY